MRNARHGEASRTCETWKPSVSNTSVNLLALGDVENLLGEQAHVHQPDHAALLSSISGKAKNLWNTKNSHASITVAVPGMAMTLRIIRSDNGCSSGAMSSRRVGTTPTNCSASSTT